MSGPASPEVKLPTIEVDVAIVGSGAAGLSAALTAAAKGLKVAVFEKHAHLGGSSAWCSGWMWIPGGCAEPAKGEKPDEPGDRAAELKYLKAELGPHVFAAQEAKVRAFLESGPAMLKFFSERFQGTMVFEKDTDTPDFHPSPGQHMGGRLVRARSFDGRHLRGEIKRLRPPFPEFKFLGMAIEAGGDLNAFLASSRFWTPRGLLGLGRVLRRLVGHAYDLITCGRSMRLVNGNALVARMMACATQFCRDRLRLYVDHAVVKLIRGASGVDGLIVSTPAGLCTVKAARGVVLACGGFPHDVRRIHELFPPELDYTGHCSVAPRQNTGEGLRLGEDVGGQVVPTAAGTPGAAAFVPVSVRRRQDGSVAVYPHFVERSKPGVIAVQRDGDRFCNEATGYHDFVHSWREKSRPGESPQAWLVCGYWSLLRFGLGMVKPFSLLPLRSLSSGYLKAGWTIEGLAERCGIPPAALRKQVALYNAGAAVDAPGLEDPQFKRGETAYDRSQGDPLTDPNPCVGRMRAPYFAVRLQVGSLGTFAGLNTDEHSRVLDANCRPIPSLYACGNDMSAVMGGMYPANGVTLASATIFGHRAACHIAAAALAAATATAPITIAVVRQPGAAIP